MFWVILANPSCFWIEESVAPIKWFQAFVLPTVTAEPQVIVPQISARWWAPQQWWSNGNWTCTGTFSLSRKRFSRSSPVLWYSLSSPVSVLESGLLHARQLPQFWLFRRDVRSSLVHMMTAVASFQLQSFRWLCETSDRRDSSIYHQEQQHFNYIIYIRQSHVVPCTDTVAHPPTQHTHTHTLPPSSQKIAPIPTFLLQEQNKKSWSQYCWKCLRNAPLVWSTVRQSSGLMPLQELIMLVCTCVLSGLRWRS